MIIGDSHVDVETGVNAGLVDVGVSYGFAPHTLEEQPPDVLVDKPQELAEVFSLRNLRAQVLGLKPDTFRRS